MEMTLSRKWTKSRTRGCKLHLTETKARFGRVRQTRADLERQLKACKREIANARERLIEADEAANCHLRDAAHHLELADSVGAGCGSRKCRTPVRREQCGDLPPGEQPSSVGSFIRGNSSRYPCLPGRSRKPRHGDRTSRMRSSDHSCP